MFAKHGYDGGSVDQISKAARSYDRMIYYYFGSKEGLFIAVIEGCYRRFNEAEATLELDEAKPVRALDSGDPLRLELLPEKPGVHHPAEHREPAPRPPHCRESLRARELSSPVIGVIARACWPPGCSRNSSGPTSSRATST